MVTSAKRSSHRLQRTSLDAQSAVLKLVRKTPPLFESVCIFEYRSKLSNMSLVWVLRSFAFIIYAVSAISSTRAESPLVGKSSTSNVSQLTTFSNLSVVSFNATSGNALKIRCDGARYGENLNVVDCKDAKKYIGSGNNQHPWVGPYTPFKKAQFPVPYRYMGCMFPTL